MELSFGRPRGGRPAAKGGADGRATRIGVRAAAARLPLPVPVPVPVPVASPAAVFGGLARERRVTRREADARGCCHCFPPPPPQGRVRTKTVKKASRVIIEKYYNRLTLDFHTNKRICEEVAIIQSKRVRNKIAGFTTHLMKRIQRGPVRGISLKLQEEERERRMDFVPDQSAINTEHIEVDADTLDMLRAMQMNGLPGVQLRQGGFRK